jgi:hypothetical protein
MIVKNNSVRDTSIVLGLLIGHINKYKKHYEEEKD